MSYQRRQALKASLKSLLNQKLNNINIELIICNNSPEITLKKIKYSRLGRLLGKFKDVKIINFNYNWGVCIRYYLAKIATHDRILFIDDDIIITDTNFINFINDSFQELRSVDILSCWNTIWVEWTDKYLSTVSLAFTQPDVTKELLETDTCGAGICMFNRMILNEKTLNKIIDPDYPLADDMAFALVSLMENGSKTYYLPAYKKLFFHCESMNGALCKKKNHYKELYARYKNLFNTGYDPVLTRIKKIDSIEKYAVTKLPLSRHYW